MVASTPSPDHEQTDPDKKWIRFSQIYGIEQRWYNPLVRAYEDEYVEKKKTWEKSYSVEPENSTLEEYKHLLLNKLNDTT